MTDGSRDGIQDGKEASHNRTGHDNNNGLPPIKANSKK
jgi:hypothetical protein